MNGSPADIVPIEAGDPLEDGLRILARIIARDIMAKRVMVAAQVQKAQGGNNNGNLQNK